MRRVIAFGETVLDKIFKGDEFIAACPGGSVVNTAISLARSGAHVELLTETGGDENGRFIRDFLHQNSISLRYSPVYSSRKTAVAIATLDEDARASYRFEKDYPPQRFTTALPVPGDNDLFAFGSFSAIEPALQAAVESLLTEAGRNNTLVFYDPNIRQHKVNGNAAAMAALHRNFASAHLIRGSDEDFQQIFETDDITALWQAIQPSACRLLVVTRGSKGLTASDGVNEYTQEAIPIQVVNTIGAGDSFNAGMIAAICYNTALYDHQKGFDPDLVPLMLKAGLHYAAAVCLSHENFIGQASVDALMGILMR